jgi:HPt (histidine-containing phosphotransfer) domain-containing protein
MTRKRCFSNGASLVARAACATLFAFAGGTVSAQNAANGYAERLADADRYVQYNRQLEQLIKSQEAEIASFNEQIAGLDGTAAAMQPLLDRMFTTLEQFIATDLPFLREERAARVETLRTMMAEEGRPSEKFRRLLEAYQIEVEYGRTMNAYPGKLEDGRDVHFVHLGRLSLMYRTTDGEESAYWDANEGAWIVDRDYARAIEDALEMAEEAVAPDLVALPIPAARESGS